MAFVQVTCPNCCDINVTKHGITSNGKQRFICKNEGCNTKTFILDYSDIGRLPETKEKIIDMALNGSGIRDTGRVLGISNSTVINELRKTEDKLQSINLNFLSSHNISEMEVHVVKVEENQLVAEDDQEAAIDEMWSFVENKGNQRWLWHAIDRKTGTVLAYVLGKRKDEVFLKLKGLLEPFGVIRYYTDDWGSYDRHLDPDTHVVGKQHTQKIERKHLTLRTRIKRLARKTICFSKLEQMHDIVIGLFVNRYEFGIPL